MRTRAEKSRLLIIKAKRAKAPRMIIAGVLPNQVRVAKKMSVQGWCRIARS
jgi:hypothetical protein